jgi:hypothetical protein
MRWGWIFLGCLNRGGARGAPVCGSGVRDDEFCGSVPIGPGARDVPMIRAARIFFVFLPTVLAGIAAGLACGKPLAAEGSAARMGVPGFDSIDL